MFQVQKWGNGLGIHIPKAITMKVGLEEDSEIDLILKMTKSLLSVRRKSQMIYCKKLLLIIFIKRFPQAIWKVVKYGESVYPCEFIKN